MSNNIIILCIVVILLSASILVLPYTINAYIIMSLNDFRNWCGF